MSIQPLQVAGQKIIYYGEQSQNLASRAKMTQQRFSSWVTILNRHKMTTAAVRVSVDVDDEFFSVNAWSPAKL